MLDCLASEGMELYHLHEGGLLKVGLCFFGDNVYVYSSFMATSYLNASEIEDAYNSLHSQFCFKVKCLFGIFTEHWSVLCHIMP